MTKTLLYAALILALSAWILAVAPPAHDLAGPPDYCAAFTTAPRCQVVQR